MTTTYSYTACSLLRPSPTSPTIPTMNARTLAADLRTHADPDIAAHSRRFFRAEPGGYGEGDRFLGIRVPVVRRVARDGRDLPHTEIRKLLRSPWHEIRLMALVVMVERFKRNPDQHDGLHTLFMTEMDRVNNWDLVDLAAPWLVGAHLLDKDRTLVHELAATDALWPQRIGVMATFAFIRAGEFDFTLAIADHLLHHDHDLIHKAVGWMLREVGNRDRATEEAFLADRYHAMPRTMLRYAIEKFPEGRRRAYLEGRA